MTHHYSISTIRYLEVLNQENDRYEVLDRGTVCCETLCNCEKGEHHEVKRYRLYPKPCCARLQKWLAISCRLVPVYWKRWKIIKIKEEDITP